MVSLEVAPMRGHLKEQWREAGVAFLGRRSELACLSLLFHICVTSTSSIFSVHSHWKEEIIIKDPTFLCVLSPHVTGFVICNISYTGSWTVWVVGGCEFLEMPSVSLTSTDFSFQVLTLLSLKERLLASWPKHFSVQSSALVGTLKVAFEKIRATTTRWRHSRLGSSMRTASDKKYRSFGSGLGAVRGIHFH